MALSIKDNLPHDFNSVRTCASKWEKNSYFSVKDRTTPSLTQYTCQPPFFSADTVDIDAECNLLRSKSTNRDGVQPRFITVTNLVHQKNESLIRVALRIASHTDLFITAAYYELKEVLSMPSLSDARLARLLGNNVLTKRDTFLKESIFGFFFDKLLRTRPIFALKLFDGFIQTAAVNAHTAGQYDFPKRKCSPNPNKPKLRNQNVFFLKRYSKDGDSWNRPSGFHKSPGRGRGSKVGRPHGKGGYNQERTSSSRGGSNPNLFLSGGSGQRS